LTEASDPSNRSRQNPTRENPRSLVYGDRVQGRKEDTDDRHCYGILDKVGNEPNGKLEALKSPRISEWKNRRNTTYLIAIAEYMKTKRHSPTFLLTIEEGFFLWSGHRRNQKIYTQRKASSSFLDDKSTDPT